MKKSILVLALSLLTTGAWARNVITESGTGSASGYCNAQDSFCPMDLSRRSENDATQQAEGACEANLGVPETYSSLCNTNCFPNQLPPGRPSFVDCRSTCTLQCDLNN